MTKFKLSEQFLEKYKKSKPPFGFDGLGELVYLRTYSRVKDNGENEQWFETVARVVEGTFNMQKEHIETHNLGWSAHRAQYSAQDMYDRMFNMKFLPPGRGLWAMGSPITEERRLFASLNNCAFVSTDTIKDDPSKPFCFLMDASMLGVGVGFDTRGAEKINIKGINKNLKKQIYQVPDTREGWVESVKLLLESYFYGLNDWEFDYSLVRVAGEPIKGFGGVSSGPGPLIDLHNGIREVMAENESKPITLTTITDIMNLIGVCVVSGNIRRTAEISFGDYNSSEYLDLKNYKVNPKRENWGWASNNSIFADLGMDYTNAALRTKLNGEPGYAWLENMQKFSRLVDPADNKDHRVSGGNPCQPGWAKLLTPQGIRQLKDVNIGDKIWSKEGWTIVTNKWSTGIKKVHAFRTSAGVFYGTDEHRLISKGIKIQAKECMSIDIIQGDILKFNVNHNIQDVVDGLVLGDGSVHKASNDLVYLLIGNNDKDYLTSELKDFIGKPRPGLTDEAYEVTTTIQADEIPHTYLREVPDRFYYGNHTKVCSFLRGLYTANGSILKANRVTLKSSSYRLIEQVQTMLSSVGISAYITTNKPTKVLFANGEYMCKESYDLNITGDRDLFLRNIGFVQKYKTQRLIDSISHIGASKKNNFDIKKIEFINTEEVFDITVDNESHTYWTQSCNVSNCLEQSLESYELCCLVETFPANHDTLEDYIATLKQAYLYAKTVTLGQTHWPDTNRVLLRNRRIGCSMSGIAQFVAKKGLHEFKTWCEEGYKKIEYYDAKYSDWLAIPKSIKKTSIKPSGTVSLLAGATPGMHWPESNYYIRRFRIGINSDLVPPLRKAGYKVEPDVTMPDQTLVVEVPVFIKGVRTVGQVSIWEQLSLAAFLQKYWADNQVSCTVTFKPEEGDQIKEALNYFQYQLKGISFLPKSEKGAYAQMPYEEITKEKYEEIVKEIKPVNFKRVKNELAEVEKFCNNDTCQLKFAVA